MEKQRLAPNETMQLREILTLNNLTLTKSITMSPLVSDDQLKNLLKNSIKTTQNNIKELRGYLEQSMIASPDDMS